MIDAISAAELFHLGNHLVQFPEHTAIHSVYIEVEDDSTKEVHNDRRRHDARDQDQRDTIDETNVGIAFDDA